MTLEAIYDLDVVRDRTARWMRTHGDHALASKQRDQAIRWCYSAGNATLAQLAQATGLSKQRIHTIVREGE